MNEAFRWKAHRDDEVFDAVTLNTTEGPAVWFVTKSRYKTSDLSGDEWRTSGVIYALDAQGERFRVDYRQRLAWAVKHSFASLYDWKHLQKKICVAVFFWRKGRILHKSTYDGRPLNLLHTVGHLPFAWDITLEQNMFPGPESDNLCMQPGCGEESVSIYALKWQYDDAGAESDATYAIGSNEYRYARRFCKRHLRRGDCGLEDADDNYTVVSGPGPDQAEGYGEDVSEAVFGGFVYV